MKRLLFDDVRKIKPAPEIREGGDETKVCFQYAPTDVPWICTREVGHSDPHIAHMAQTVMVGWDEGDEDVTEF